MLEYSIILDTDSYKFSHYLQMSTTEELLKNAATYK